MDVIAFFAGIAALIGGGIYLGQVQRARRTRAVRAFAQQMDWAFEESVPFPAALMEVEPFSGGHSHRVRNRVTRLREGEPVLACDLHYTVGHGKHSVHHRLGAVQVPLARRLPVFSVRAEHFGHRIASVFGMQDIDFPQHPVFSKKYLLRGPDEAAVAAVFTPALVEFFEAHRGIGAACTGSELVAWQDRLAEPMEMENLMEMGVEMRRRLGQIDGEGGMGKGEAVH